MGGAVANPTGSQGPDFSAGATSTSGDPHPDQKAPTAQARLTPENLRRELGAGGATALDAWARFCSLARGGDPAADELIAEFGRGVFPDLATAFVSGLSDPSLIVRAASIEGLHYLSDEIAATPLMQGFAAESDSGLAQRYVEALWRHKKYPGVEDALVKALDRADTLLHSTLRSALCDGNDPDRTLEMFRPRFVVEKDRTRRRSYLTDFGYLASKGSDNAAETLAQVVRTGSDKTERKIAFNLLRDAHRLSLLTKEEIAELEE